MRVRVYVDGFNFDHGMRRRARQVQAITGEAVQWKWLDVGAMIIGIARSHWGDAELARCYYFTARVRQRYQGDEAPQRQDVYIRTLRSLGTTGVDSYYHKETARHPS